MYTTTEMPSVTNHNITVSKNEDSLILHDFTKNVNLIEYLTKICNEGSYRKLSDFSKLLSSNDTDDSLLSDWLTTFRDNIFFLDKENERITASLLRMKWAERSQNVVTLYQDLIKNLVSAHSYYLTPVLHSLIDIFLSATDDANFNSEDQRKKLKNVHDLLKGILTLIPMSPPVLCKLLADRFPYFKRPSQHILGYTANVLTICNYLPPHRLTILMDLIDKYLQIDVHCPRETIALWEAEREETLENNLKIGIVDAVDTSKTMAYPLANTLDTLMQTLFKYIDATCNVTSGDDLDWEATKRLYRELLTAFDRLVLPTFGCAHVQFVMFYVCGLKLALCEGFIDFLWNKVKNPTTSNVIRQTAAFYIGSLLARASYINMSTVTACFDLMTGWIHSYVNNNDSGVSCDVAAHGTFHCVCQTLFYVFAFRHKEFVSMENGFQYLRSLNFERILASRLNPLKFCQPTIVQNFASVARNYQIAYCYPIIERNNRSLVVASTHSDNFAAMNTFFPFDPYLLKNSKKWIDPIYRVYNAQNDEDLMDDDDESIVDEEQMFSYGSSPGFKQH